MQTRSPRLLESTPLSGVDKRLADTTLLLLEAGLRPVVDKALERVLACCPACRSDAADPDGIHRPLVVGCHTRDLALRARMVCTAGCDPEAIRTALLTPPVDWEAIAHDYAALAADAIELLEAHLCEWTTLQVAA